LGKEVSKVGHEGAIVRNNVIGGAVYLSKNRVSLKERRGEIEPRRCGPQVCLWHYLTELFNQLRQERATKEFWADAFTHKPSNQFGPKNDVWVEKD
jgi:hypothetical protein